MNSTSRPLDDSIYKLRIPEEFNETVVTFNEEMVDDMVLIPLMYTIGLAERKS
jgi:hypothetical protein